MVGMDTAAFHYIQNKENVSLGLQKASADYKMSHAGSAKPLFTYLPVGPCLLDVLRLLSQKLSSSEQIKPSGFMERFCSGSCVSVLTELQQQLHQLWT